MYITKVELHRFKRYKDDSIELNAGLSLVVGANNSGKSTILQALAAWQFCKTLVEIEKGRIGWLQTTGKTGVGMGIVDFTPLQVPSLAHLWTNLKTGKVSELDGYTLKINVFWKLNDGTERNLEMGMSLANDRLFVKSMSTNLKTEEIIDVRGNPVSGNVPSVAYLPPFAGITDREGRLTPAMRERLVGQGLSGGVIRNMLFELYERNKAERIRLKSDKPKIKQNDLAELRRTDPWEMLSRAIQKTFKAELKIVPFNERYHSYLRVEIIKGDFQKGGFKRHPGYNTRDLMVEGQGFLQWLSVYALVLTPDINVVLLDEPDAHLNAALQRDLLQSLEEIAHDLNKQILMATHSPELIRLQDHDRILAVTNAKTKYLNDSNSKIGILAGIGTIHTPTIHALLENRRILILEAPSDLRLLKIVADRAEFQWPKNVVPWFWTGKASERRQLFIQLQKEIPKLTGISLRDRDSEEDATVDDQLIDRGYSSAPEGLAILKWRRRHIENYLLCVPAIARAANKPLDEIEDFFRRHHALALPRDASQSDVALAIRDAHGKELMTGKNSIESTFSVTREQVASALEPTEVAADFRTFFARLEALSKEG